MAVGQELLRAALGYAVKRVEELRANALTDAVAFATALGVPGFVDGDGAVAARLAAAKLRVDQAVAALGGGNLVATADHLAGAFVELEAAAAKVGRPLDAALAARIGWANANPQGLVRQLGLPAIPPSIAVRDGALEYGLGAPGKRLAATPVLGFDAITLTARLRIDGQRPTFAVSVEIDGAEVGVGGGPIASLLGNAASSVSSDLVVGFDTDHELTLSGTTAPRVVLPARTKVGPVDLREIAIELPPGTPDTFDVSGSIVVDLGGVITATVDGAGIRATVDPARVASGGDAVTIGLKAPTGVGLALDTGLVRGGGFLGVRPDGGFGGALQLRLGPIEVKAVGLLHLDPFALVVVMSIEFIPAIDLSFGFTLNAVGGVIGIEHRLDTDALRARLSDGALDHIMFPDDPVGAAPAILDTLTAVFPMESGSIVIGPMVEVGWGRPISFLTAQVGVILSLPDPKIVIIGRVRIAVPAPELPIVDLRAAVYGEITPDHLLIIVSLHGSRLAGFSLSGDIGLLIRWTEDAEFAVSAGGFHPRFQPPKELSGMERLQIDLSPPAILELRAEAYFAVTTNSLQLGARVEMGADLGVASISGHFGFDALVVFSPHFMFMIDLGIGLTVRALGVTLCGVDIQLHLEGPGPWRAEGSAEVEILWWTVDIDVGPYTWGDEDNPPPEPVHPRRLVFDALDHNPGAWQALAPPDADRLVTLVPAAPSQTEATVHPLGMFDVRQHAVPLETVIVRVGPNPVPDNERRVHFGVPLVNGTEAGAVSPVTDLFSAGNFLDLTDDQKMSRPSFEPMMAGARIRPPGADAEEALAREVELRYETFVCLDPTLVRIKSRASVADILVTRNAAAGLGAGSAGRTVLRAGRRYATEPDPIVMADSGESMVRSKVTMAAAGVETMTFTHAAEAVSGGDLQVARLGVG